MSVRADVDRGLEVVFEIERLKEELKAIESRLEAAGLDGEQIDLVDEEREGKQFLAHGTGAIVPVVFTADLLTQTFQADSDKHDRIDAASNGHFLDFYAPLKTFKTIYESGKFFRRKAGEILGSDGPAFITACLQRDKHGLPKSATKIEWSRVQKKEHA